MTELLSEQELDLLKSARNGKEWNNFCDQIKSVRGGQCPSDWYDKVIRSDLAAITFSCFEK